jgi:hypothetical protein
MPLVIVVVKLYGHKLCHCKGPCLTRVLKLKLRFRLVNQSAEWSTLLMVGTAE